MLTFAHNMLSMCAFALAHILDNSVTNRLRVYVYIYMVSRILEISLVTVFFFFFFFGRLKEQFSTIFPMLDTLYLLSYPPFLLCIHPLSWLLPTPSFILPSLAFWQKFLPDPLVHPLCHPPPSFYTAPHPHFSWSQLEATVQHFLVDQKAAGRCHNCFYFPWCRLDTNYQQKSMDGETEQTSVWQGAIPSCQGFQGSKLRWTLCHFTVQAAPGSATHKGVEGKGLHLEDTL